MNPPIQIRSGDPILETLAFKPYRNATERAAMQYQPGPDQPASFEIKTPWGEMLQVNVGDYIVNELAAPNDRWPVNQDIFEQTYVRTKPGHFIKSAVTMLVPLVDLTKGDEEQLVMIETMEGTITVRAGDFYLARGVKGEIWGYPKDKADSTLLLVEEETETEE